LYPSDNFGKNVTVTLFVKIICIEVFLFRELEEMSKGENTVKWTKGQRISWLGHLERMEEERMPKKIFTHELEWTIRRGKPGKDSRRK
jgi:hypothetical protein